MIIRKFLYSDCDEVSNVCMHSFMNTVADTLSEQGILTFARLASCLLSSLKIVASNIKLTVHASTTSVSAYERYGFISVGDIADLRDG
ncbi:hypothetical protein [Pseudoalteromonas byunsanensis]|uniref:N-acetyltransferase domain-containing protein n=1 Tax=Pseudoalteromonas byunsanensis TaxID=327939 RepID=A0A1S1N9I3_9GAMM|nr:hypothetical protein [Pseudoalteromonas byunsanensis]OHU96023.1 hypothetical protein BIW53_09495 [Pseudoalteromonas byunsanensis]